MKHFLFTQSLSRTRVELVFRVLFRQSYKSLFICNAFGSSPAF